MHAISANQRVALNSCAALQPQSDASIILLESGTTGTQVNRIRLLAPHGARQHVEQIRAVDGEIGKAVALDRDRPEVEELPRLAGIPQADFLALRLARERLQLLADAERVEHARAIGGKLHARADFLQLGRLLVDLDVDSVPEQREGGGETADPRACNQDAQPT